MAQMKVGVRDNFGTGNSNLTLSACNSIGVILKFQFQSSTNVLLCLQMHVALVPQTTQPIAILCLSIYVAVFSPIVLLFIRQYYRLYICISRPL